MKRLLLATFCLAPALAFAQGALTPPGAPAPTMKTLDQLEPRTPIQAGSPGVSLDQNGGYIIEAPGSYYLTGPLEIRSGNALSIYAADVTLDLRGFTISSTADGSVVRGTAIYAPNAADHLIIRNGHISGAMAMQNNGTLSGRGFDHGIVAESISAVFEAASNTLVEGVTVKGVLHDGIVLERPNSIIRDCAAYQCGGFGLRARVVTGSTANLCRSTAIRGTTVSNCEGSSMTGFGVSATTAINCRGEGEDCGLHAVTASNCTGTSYAGTGLQATASAIGCTGSTTVGPCGLRAGNDYPASPGTAENCSGAIAATTNASTTGLIATTASNCIGINRSGIGLSAEVATNCFASTEAGTYAMDIAGSATNCRGNNTKAGGKAIRAAIAVSCTAANGTIDTATDKKFLGTP